MPKKSCNVLFLCAGNAARSILAEAILNREGMGHFRAFSAGFDLEPTLDPAVENLLRKLNYPVDELYPKSWEHFVLADAPMMDFVFTVCDRAVGRCPSLPGNPMIAHWGVPDPAEFRGNDVEKAIMVAETYRMLSNRIGVFVNLPIQSLDRLALQRRLQDIGGAAQPAAQ